MHALCCLSPSPMNIPPHSCPSGVLTHRARRHPLTLSPFHTHTHTHTHTHSTRYEHPAELFHVSLLSLIVPIALGTHPLTQWLWLIVSVALSVDAHAGYDLPIHQMLLAVLPFSNRWIKGGLGSSEHHDLHHQWPRTNFQPFFTYADLLFGTSFEQSSFNKKNRKERPAAKLPATTIDAGDDPSSDAMEAAAAAVTEG